MQHSYRVAREPAVARTEAVRIGVTATVDRRRAVHERSGKGWTEMGLLYTSASKRDAERMETHLIDRARTLKGARVENVHDGGWGLLPNTGPYWVYILRR
jgi:hypothetical protein